METVSVLGEQQSIVHRFPAVKRFQNLYNKFQGNDHKMALFRLSRVQPYKEQVVTKMKGRLFVPFRAG